MDCRMLRFGPLGSYCRTTIGLIPKTVMLLWRGFAHLAAVWEVDAEGLLDSSRREHRSPRLSH